MFSWTKASLCVLFSIGFLISCQSPSHRLPSQELQADQKMPSDRDERAEAPVQVFDRLVDYKPYKYELLFTDPECGVYTYKTPVKSNSGNVLTQKPQNVYCKNRYDLARSGSRESSPQFRLVEWINRPDTKEIYLTYLSFSNKTVKEALCEAGKRGVRIRLMMSVEDPRYDPNTPTASEQLVACSPNIEKKGRGLENDLGYAHNKFLIINPHSKTEFKIVFSSGNMSSGPVIHHENWNFVTTSPDSYFAQVHKCAMDAAWNDSFGRSRATYLGYIKSCRSKITAPEEKDIKVFFIPGEGEPEAGVTRKTASEYMIMGDNGFPGIRTAKKIWIGCHRFFYSKMIYELKNRMKSGSRAEIRIVADDDTYYKANDPNFHEGDTSPEEWDHMQTLKNAGAQVKLMETNSNEHQLHHSKYLIFADYDAAHPPKNPVDGFKAVMTGSANLTGAAFKKNWENTYYITIPEVVKKFAEHYVYTWDKLATSVDDLPVRGSVAAELNDQPIITPSPKPEIKN